MAKFEVGLYNKLVADKLAEGLHHRHYDDSWAETHYIEVEAETADAARQKVAVQHSERNGFVILSVEEKRDKFA